MQNASSLFFFWNTNEKGNQETLQ